jgi:putative transposase
LIHAERSERISTRLIAWKGFSEMKQNRHTVDQIIAKLRRANVEIGKGKKVPEICRLLEITDQTYYRCRQKYGGMQPEMAKQLKALQKENARLKKLVAEQALDMEILKEASQGNR